MFSNLYQSLVLKKPRLVFLVLILITSFFLINTKDFRLDASSETLLIEGDPDLEYLKDCLLYTSPSPRDVEESRMPSSA